MSTRGEERRGLGAAAKLVSERASALVRLELQLAAAELKQKIAEIGVGIGLLVAAAVFGLFAIGFGLTSIAAGLATTLPTWAALLIVTGGLIVLVAVLAIIGRAKVQKGTPPVPEQAIVEAKLTTEALKNGHR
jgi:putative superfamily III holin-X